MIPRTQEHNWGSHSVRAERLNVNIQFTDDGQINFGGAFRTTTANMDSEGNLIASVRGPDINLGVLEHDDEVSLSDGTKLKVSDIVEGVQRFYEVAYDRAYAKSQEEPEEIIE